jgi:hypothetical protein
MGHVPPKTQKRACSVQLQMKKVSVVPEVEELTKLPLFHGPCSQLDQVHLETAFGRLFEDIHRISQAIAVRKTPLRRRTG